MGKLFGTDGVRGVANEYPMTVEMVVRIGRAAALVCGSDRSDGRQKVLIGQDTRRSSDMVGSALAAGACSAGADVGMVGVISTPGLAFLTRELTADAGLMVSASHNPFADNGVKVFSGGGTKLHEDAEDAIEALARAEAEGKRLPTGGGLGTVDAIEDGANRYARFAQKALLPGVDIGGMKIAVDCANGAESEIAPAVLSGLGAEVLALNCAPDGVNINDRCGSEHPGGLSEEVVASGADVGLAFDGDGDRLIAVDEKGGIVRGDEIIAVTARMYRDRGMLTNNTVVSTVMSNLGLGMALREMGIDHAMSSVGDRQVLKVMRAKGAVVGGEDSGHAIFLDHHTTGDGLVSALRLLSAVRLEGAPLSELAGIMTRYSQKTINVHVARKQPLAELVEVGGAIRAAEQELGDDGRVLVRYSGTQPMCRVMVEGPTAGITDRLCAEIAAVVERVIGQ